MRKLLKKSMAAVLTASMAMSMTACAGKAVKPGSEESEAKTSEAAAANVETSEAAGEEGLTTEDITLTISWWGGESRHEATQKAIEAFMKKYPNIKVESSFGGWTGWESKMGLAFSQGKADDIVQMGPFWHTMFGGDGEVFYDLNQLSDYLDLSQFENLEPYTVDGELRAVPWQPE